MLYRYCDERFRLGCRVNESAFKFTAFDEVLAAAGTVGLFGTKEAPWSSARLRSSMCSTVATSSSERLGLVVGCGLAVVAGRGGWGGGGWGGAGLVRTVHEMACF